MSSISESPHIQREAVEGSSSGSGERRILTHILREGILSRYELIQRGVSFEGGYDAAPSRQVCLNVVTTVLGISKALFSAANGIITVGMERSGNGRLISELVSEQQIEEKALELWADLKSKDPGIKDFMYNLARKNAKNKLLASNEGLLALLRNRVQNVAVFVLNIDPTRDERLASDCRETRRGSIPVDAIRAVILSKNLRENAELRALLEDPPKPFIFVEDQEEDVTYAYQTERGPETCDLKTLIPDYETALKSIFASEFDSEGKPMFIHAARI